MKNNITPHSLSLRLSESQRLIFLMLIILFMTTILSARSNTNFAEDYVVRPGDLFFIQIISLETEELVVPVTMTGQLILFPLSSPVKVSGYPLAEAQEIVLTELKKHLPGADIFVDMVSMQPYSVHLLGAVKKPGEYVVDTLVTLYQALKMANGLSPAASKRVSLTRQDETLTFDLNSYLREGDLSQNPLLMSEDRVKVDFAREFAKVYVVTDSVNYVEYFEMETEKHLAELLPLIRDKHPYSDYQSIYIKQDSILERVEPHHLVKAGDSVYINPEESYIYVRGQVNSPDRFTYVANKGPQYYISLAGGITRIGSRRTIHIVSKDGTRSRYRGQDLKEGDTAVVPVSMQTWIVDYITPVSTILSLITTIVVLTR